MKKKNPEQTRSAVRVFPISDSWKFDLDRSPRGIKPTLHNALIALRKCPAWSGVLAFDEMRCRIALRKATPWGYLGPWMDHHLILTCDWLQGQGINILPNLTRHAVDTVARERAFHPVRDYLESLKHDGVPRVERWLTTYLGVPETAYSRAVGQKWLISAVARIFEPGCQADCVLVLEGRQGMKKSSTFRVLAGEWFTDDVEEMGSKDAKMGMAGVWIIELSELDSMSRAESSKIKAFTSRKVDRFRPPYGFIMVEQPRQCILCGTTNDRTPLKDYTGNRRWWFVKPTQIDLKKLIADRDQIWAETVVFHRQKIPWWIGEDDQPELILLTEAEQTERLQYHPWHDEIAIWLAEQADTKGESFTFSIADIWRQCLQKELGNCQQRDQNDIVRILQALKYKRFRHRDNNVLTWRYRSMGELEDE